MINFKKTSMAILTLSTSAVFAGTMGPVCVPGNVTVPCETRAWDFGIQALYLKSVYDEDLAYMHGYTPVNGVQNHNDVNLDWGWGFRLEGSYHFSTGNDLTVNWIRYEKSTDFNNVIIDDTGTRNISDFSWKPRFNAVNVEFGQHADFGMMKNIRFHGGLQYANIKTDFSRRHPNNEGVIVTGYHYMKFNGIGPRTGLDMSYDFGNSFAVYGTGAAAILVGTSDFSTVPGGINGVANIGSKTAIVPELEAKLGATYTYTMSNGNLTLDAGWMLMNYFNAQHIFTNDLASGESDFALHGPYIGLKYVGNI